MIVILPVSLLLGQSSKKQTRKPTIEVYAEDVDSLLFLAEKYLYADSALNRAVASIRDLQQALTKKSDLVLLQGEQLKNYLKLIDTLKATITNDRERGILERLELKSKLKNRGRIIFGESALITILLAIILL
jgi:archaellum biogenesis ATPase FlaH